jgi:hypothetical protein
VSLPTSFSATRFLSALNSYPLLATKTSRIVVNIADDSRLPYRHSLQLDPDSRVLLQSLEQCKATITHLHVFPLPDRIRPRLFAIIQDMPALQTLVCSARLHQPTYPLGADEEQEEGSQTDRTQGPSTLILPRLLRTFELDLDRSWNGATRPIFLGASLRGLRKIRLRTVTDRDVLWEILRECTRLEVLELYLEQLPSLPKCVQVVPSLFPPCLLSPSLFPTSFPPSSLSSPNVSPASPTSVFTHEPRLKSPLPPIEHKELSFLPCLQ